jgi:enolase
VFHALKKLIDDKGMSTAVGDEGGFAPSVANHEAAIQLILRGDRQGRLHGRDAGRHRRWTARQRVLQGRQVPACRRGADARRRRTGPTAGDVVRQVPDHQHRGRHGRGRLGRLEAADSTDRSASKVQLVGDDIFVTNTRILREGIARASPTRS